MQKIRKIIQQTFWQGVVKIITTISGFLILGIISRKFGEAGTGDFTLALTYLAFFYIFADFAFNAHVLKRLQDTGYRVQEEWKKLLGTRILWSSLLIIISLLILIFLPSNFSTEFKLAVLLGSSTILFYGLNITAHALFQAKLKYQFDTIPTLLGVGVGLAAIFLMTKQGLPIYFMVLGYVLAWGIHGTGTYLFTLKFSKNILPIFDFKYIFKLFKEVLPLSATLILNVLYFRADSFILAFYKSSADVGVYNLAYQVFQAILVLPTFAMNSFYPMMLETLKIQVEKFKFQIKLSFCGLFFVALFISFFTFLLSPMIIKLITGSGFSGSIESLQILSFGFPAYFLSALLMWVMVAKKKYKSLLIVYGLGLMVNIVANLIFIPQYGYLAASWITGISEYFILSLQVSILLKR